MLRTSEGPSIMGGALTGPEQLTEAESETATAVVLGYGIQMLSHE